jgi:hypothetical protein
MADGEAPGERFAWHRSKNGMRIGAARPCALKRTGQWGRKVESFAGLGVLSFVQKLSQ